MIELSNWLTKQQAADILLCSTKTIERFAGEGKLQKEIWRRPGKAAIAVYHPEDVERIHSLRNPQAVNGHVMPVEPPRSQTSQTHATENRALVSKTPPSTDSLLAAAEAFFERFIIPPKELKMYLTISEASQVSGVSEKLLKRLCRKRLLGFRDCGEWKIARVDLERIPDLLVRSAL